MRKSPEEFRRENVKQLFDKILKETKVKLEPISITASESLDDDFTTVEFSFEDGDKIISTQAKGKGFVDGLFHGLYSHYILDYPSLEKIKLVDIMVNPIMKTTRNNGPDAKARVIFSVEVDKHGLAEFCHQSRSMIYSGFVAALEAFQFYINCEKTFHRIQLILEDASARNRGDIIQSCVADLSKLTEVNSYERKKG